LEIPVLEEKGLLMLKNEFIFIFCYFRKWQHAEQFHLEKYIPIKAPADVQSTGALFYAKRTK